jgi:predicted TIM-barrel enzyme
VIKLNPRAAIVEQLGRVAESGGTILAAGVSTGLVAKCAAAGGADLLVVYSTGRSRHMGLPTTVLGDSNAITLEMIREIRNVVSDVPIIGGAEASDPRYQDLSELVEEFSAVGYSGVINFPTLGLMPERSRQREDVGLGYSRDIQLIRTAHKRDLFTMAYVFDAEQAAAMTDAGADCIVAHVGLTVGGVAGAGKSARSLSDALSDVRDMHSAARAVRPSVILLAHGGPFARPQDMPTLYEGTQSQGFVGASSIERIPIEEAVTGVTKAFKAVTVAGR